MVQVSSDFEKAGLEDELDEEIVEPFELNDSVLDLNLEEGALENVWCPACKTQTLHSVIANETGRHIVSCAVCSTEHEREELSGNTQPLHKSLLTEEDNASDETRRACWQRLTENLTSEDIQNYSIRGQFKEGDFLQHAKFGVGVVCEDLGDGKLEVLFEDKLRRLVCGR